MAVSLKKRNIMKITTALHEAESKQMIANYTIDIQLDLNLDINVQN